MENKTKIKDICTHLELFAPLSYQESYDNCGLLIGNRENTVTNVLLSLDITEAVMDEAIQKKSNLIIAHHPLIFGGLKKITGSNFVERIVIKAIKNDIAIYAGHTNFDSVKEGVNKKICDKIGLSNQKILSPISNELKKLVVFVPLAHADKVRNAICEAGAGHIGNYDYCSFNLNGKGSFRAGDAANPFVGNKGEIHMEDEIRIETIFPKARQSDIISTLLGNHPYEEVAYDIYPLDNKFENAGMGMVGELEQEEAPIDFLNRIKKIFNCKIIKHTAFHKEKIRKIAVCGGSGSFALKDAIRLKADIFLTGDIKYHDFFNTENRIIIADIGHYESEQFTKEIFYDLLTKKFSTFAINFSEIHTSPINYL